MSSKTKSGALFWVPKNLKAVCAAIDSGCSSAGGSAVNRQLISLLKSLNYVEKWFISIYFCRLVWNVGSAKVLAMLNRLRILTASEYILSQKDNEHIQLVLNDLLETKFDLLANLVNNGHFDLMTGSKINEYVDESIRRLFVDLVKNPALNNMDYLNGLRYKLPKDLHTKFVNNHLKLVLSIHKTSTRTAFGNFSNWITLNLNQCEIINNFYGKGVYGNELDVVKNLFTMSSAAEFKGWKNYLLLLAHIVKNCPIHCTLFIKKWLKDRLKIVAENGSREIMAHLLLSFRVFYIFQEDSGENYSNWFKQNIGDMKFVLKDTEFKTVMEVLTDLVPYEADEEYLKVHVKTSISPPAMCSHLCRDYKQLCRTRISDVTGCNNIVQHGRD